MSLKIGDRAPEKLGRDQNGKQLHLSDFSGQKLVLYFYPKDDTSGCTAQACNLRDHYQEFRSNGYEIIGVSQDDEKSHQKFIDKQQLPFRLIADTDRVLNEEFGVWREKSMYGRKYMGTVRTTFIIDENGVIVDVIEKVQTNNHTSQILS